MTVWNGMYPVSARKSHHFLARQAYSLAQLENCTIYGDRTPVLRGDRHKRINKLRAGVENGVILRLQIPRVFVDVSPGL